MPAKAIIRSSDGHSCRSASFLARRFNPCHPRRKAPVCNGAMVTRGYPPRRAVEATRREFRGPFVLAGTALTHR